VNQRHKYYSPIKTSFSNEKTKKKTATKAHPWKLPSQLNKTKDKLLKVLLHLSSQFPSCIGVTCEQKPRVSLADLNFLT